MSQKKISLFLLLLVGFIEYIGIGLVFPLFGLLLFDPHSAFLPPETSDAVRGFWMGLLIATGPFVLFFSSPLLGILSDQKGRKKILVFTLLVGLASYVVALFGVAVKSLALLLIYRILYGISAGNLTVIQASMVDLSSPEEKAKNFGLYNMALAAGFSLGPFLGGVLIHPASQGVFAFGFPFCAAFVFTLLNLLLVIGKYRETRLVKKASRKIDWMEGIYHLKKAMQIKELRLIFCVMFLFFFGWDFFIEFASVLLIKRFEFSGVQIGSFYAFTGILYAFCAGIVIRPIVNRFPPKKVLQAGLFFGGIYFLFLSTIHTGLLLWVSIPPLLFFISLVYPTATTIVSNDASQEAQGEILGVYGSIQSLALIISPFCAGSLIGAHPELSVIFSGVLMVIAAIIFKIGSKNPLSAR